MKKFILNPWDAGAPKHNRKLRNAAKLALKKAKADWRDFLVSIGWDADAQDFSFN